MPEFEIVSREEALRRSNTGKRAQVLGQYIQYVESLGRDEAGRVTLCPGETMATVRRRLGAAIKTTGKSVQIKRVGMEIYFWEEPVKGRGGRPRKNNVS